MAIAVVDIGSNSVRLVVFDAPGRAPTVAFNEKAASALGRGVANTGLLPADGVGNALAALARFRILSEIAGVDEIIAVATSAVREARNGPEFLGLAEAALGAPIATLYGACEARFAALGVVSGLRNPDGVAGDLGGGSLELTEIEAGAPRDGMTLRLGGLALADLSEGDPRRAARIARDALAGAEALARLQARDFYAVGGVWRALARLHMRETGYPLEVMHNYVMPATPGFAALVDEVGRKRPEALRAIPSARRSLLIYGAVVLDEILRAGAPRRVVLSALGVREGLLYERLAPERRAEDPLLVAARELNDAHARDPAHGEELFAWTSAFLSGAPLAESESERRLRHAACLLADIAWRAHPDHRAETAFTLILNAGLIGLDHGERVALALTAACRHVADADEIPHPARALLSPAQLARARALGAAMRVAFVISTGRRGVLPRAPLRVEGGRIALELGPELAALGNDRLMGRLRQVARQFGGDAEIRAID